MNNMNNKRDEFINKIRSAIGFKQTVINAAIELIELYTPIIKSVNIIKNGIILIGNKWCEILTNDGESIIIWLDSCGNIEDVLVI